MDNDPLYARGTCSILVITCSDFRFKSVERAFAEAAGLVDDYDLIARPGAVRSLAFPRNAAARESMEDEILMLWKAHGFTRVLMVHHLSCRAYDDLVFGDGERDVHIAHLQAAGPALARRFEGVTAEGYLIALADGALRVERVDGE